MKNAFLSLLTLSVFLLPACSSKSVKTGTDAVLDSEVLAQEMMGMVTTLASDEFTGREAGTPGIEKAAVYIENYFESNGVDTYFDTYRDELSNFEVPTYNIVGLVEGEDKALQDEYIIIGAHYDHIGNGNPVGGDNLANGANDNAAGTSAVMALAKHFAKVGGNKRSLLFCLFSAEEKGLLGSKHLATKLKAADLNLHSMVNFEMIGLPMKRDYLAYITGYERSNMASKMNEFSGENTIGFFPGAKDLSLFRRSDNYPFFLEFGLPAQTISTFDFTNFDYYHHVDDEASELDGKHMADVVIAIAPSIKGLANMTGPLVMTETD